MAPSQLRRHLVRLAFGSYMLAHTAVQCNCHTKSMQARIWVLHAGLHSCTVQLPYKINAGWHLGLACWLTQLYSTAPIQNQCRYAFGGCMLACIALQYSSYTKSMYAGIWELDRHGYSRTVLLPYEINTSSYCRLIFGSWIKAYITQACSLSYLEADHRYHVTLEYQQRSTEGKDLGKKGQLHQFLVFILSA